MVTSLVDFIPAYLVPGSDFLLWGTVLCCWRNNKIGVRDLMVSPSNLLSLALLYICILFAVAWYADRSAGRESEGKLPTRSPIWRGLV